MKHPNCSASASQEKSITFVSAEDLARALSGQPFSYGNNDTSFADRFRVGSNLRNGATVLQSPTVPVQSRKKAATLPTLPEAIEIVSIQLLWRLFNLPGEPARACLSPFREESRPSFSVYVGADGKSRFNDFGAPGTCGDGFDFFQLCTEQSGRQAVQAFRELAARIQDGEIEVPSGVKLRRLENVAVARPLTSVEREQMVNAADALATQPELSERIAMGRGWRVETIRDLARAELLGWYDGQVAFIYRTGVKLRSDRDGERHIRWLFGRGSLWRGDLISAAEKIYICEGETDAISLIDAGIEEIANTAVIALPSATTFRPSWAPLFSGKDVVLCLDNDQAGENATFRIGRALRPYAKNLDRLNLTAAFHAD
jgi:hypothetical protein